MLKLSSITKICLVFIYFILLVYVSLPIVDFPYQPLDSVQSLEDADTESPLRRAFFTNYSREEVLSHYVNEMRRTVFGITLPTYRLNYPPEDAYTLIRDQTRSTFLEEIVHPLRESIYVNGFKPKEDKDAIWYKGSPYQQKITVRFVSSDLLHRVLILTSSFILLIIIVDQFFDVFPKVFREWTKKIW
jgi:hypothetical protein